MNVSTASAAVAALFCAVSVPAIANNTNNQVRVYEPSEQNDNVLNPLLIGGTIANPADWPASPWVGNCSSTLIGEKVLLVAAHCTGNGATKNFTIGSTRYAAQCDHHPSYRSNNTADWALCVISTPITGVPFESLANTQDVSCAAGQSFLLTGYGCTRWGGGTDGRFRTGRANATRCPSGTNYDTVTRGNVALCSGDSGGGAYIVDAEGKRKVVGVNSRSNTTDTSYVSSTYSASFMNWARTWADGKGLKVCGMHADATGCTDGGGEAPDCSDEVTTVANARTSLAQAEQALNECRAGL